MRNPTPEPDPTISLGEAHRLALAELAKLSDNQSRILLTLADIIIDAYLEEHCAESPNP
jgi:hypothetical protein